MPPDLELQIRFTDAKPVPTFGLNGVYYGDDGIPGLNKTIQPLWDALLALNDSVPDVTIFKELSWMESVVVRAPCEIHNLVIGC